MTRIAYITLAEGGVDMDGTVSLAEKLTTAVTDIFSVMNLSFDQVIDNEYLVLFLGASVIGLGIGIFKGLRSAV